MVADFVVHRPWMLHLNHVIIEVLPHWVLQQSTSNKKVSLGRVFSQLIQLKIQYSMIGPRYSPSIVMESSTKDTDNPLSTTKAEICFSEAPEIPLNNSIT